ncbi:MAG: Glycosyl transferase family 2 [uncultured bacterium]|nr:MAG: Glycosyl transferase family 2 [uncultured bacterium]
MQIHLTVIILTYNESIHIDRAIKNVSKWADKIIILDSYSEDDTVEKASTFGIEVIYRKFDNYKNQREYAIEYVKNKTEWLFFLDADEYLTEELKQEIKSETIKSDISGYYIPRRFIFMNKWIKWGGYYPIYLLRLFRPEHAYLDGVINEHVKVSGKIDYLKNDFVDHNLKGINSWIEKHNSYATFEALELIRYKAKQYHFKKINIFSTQSERKQWLRYNIWNRLPIVIRPPLYFIYRYFFRLGFLDGKEGFIYHFLQGFWFWLLIDIKYIESKNIKCPE